MSEATKPLGQRLLAPVAALVLTSAAFGQVNAAVPSESQSSLGGQEEDQLDPIFDRDLLLGDEAREQFSLHKLNYVAMGNNDLKLQFSFKYRFLEQIPAFAALTNMTAFDIYEPKDPARDSTYNGELFYRWKMKTPTEFLFDAGYWHASNGQGDTPEKRSLDRFYVRGLLDFELLGRPLLATPTGYITVSESKYSSDISDYYGQWEVGFVWKNLLSPEDPGADLDLMLDIVDPITGEGSYTLGLQMRLEDHIWSPNLYVQYFAGYGDTLLEYAEYKTELRFGMTFYY